MDLADRLRALATRVQTQLEFIQTEEATKNALVMPFIAALGYDVFDPTEVTPELVADVGIKKGEKVDYAILKDGKPIILFECKSKGAKLSLEHASQLHRYFHVTSARFGILTNGIQYRFYTDLEKANTMDSLPFLEIDLFNLKDHEIDEVRKFAKSYFDEAGILDAASVMKYTKEFKRLLTEEFRSPSTDFVRHFASKVYPGRLTQSVLDNFAEHLMLAYRQTIAEHISDRLQNAMDAETPKPTTPVSMAETQIATSTESLIETTDEEIEAFYIVKSIIREDVDLARVALRDVQSYCSVLLDDSNRKPIVRFYFNQKDWKIGLFDNSERKEEKISVETLDDIYKLSVRLVKTIQMYEQQAGETR